MHVSCLRWCVFLARKAYVLRMGCSVGIDVRAKGCLRVVLLECSSSELYIVQVMGVAMGAHAHTLTLMLPMTGIAVGT